MHADHPSEEHLIDRALDELPPPARPAIDSHLERCAACRETVAALREAVERARPAPRPAAPAGILVDLLAAQAAARAAAAGGGDQRRRRPPMRRAMTAVALAASLAALFLTGFRMGQRSAPGPERPDGRSSWQQLGGPDSLPAPPEIPFETVESSINS